MRLCQRYDQRIPFPRKSLEALFLDVASGLEKTTLNYPVSRTWSFLSLKLLFSFTVVSGTDTRDARNTKNQKATQTFGKIKLPITKPEISAIRPLLKSLGTKLL